MTLGILRKVVTYRNALKRPFSVSAIRKSSDNDNFWTYREPPYPPPKLSVFLAEALGGLMWWWILWHVWTEPEHLVGGFPAIDPSKWTDEELGIPPDDEN